MLNPNRPANRKREAVTQSACAVSSLIGRLPNRYEASEMGGSVWLPAPSGKPTLRSVGDNSEC